jgi:excisionase family DNA binding protein
MERLLDICEVSEILGVTKATIYSWTSQNKIPHIKLSNRLLKFREKEIIDWIKGKSVITKPESLAETRKTSCQTIKTPQLQNDCVESIIRNAKEKILYGGG